MIVYAKHLDLLKPDNKEFMKLVRNPSRLIASAEKQLRFEVNHTTFRSIKNRFDVQQNRLQDVLKSSQPVNHDFLKKILNVTDIKQTTLFDEYENFEGAGTDFLMMKGIQSIIESLDYSDVQVRAFFQHIFPNENTFKEYWYGKKAKTSIKKILESLQQKKFGVSGETVDSICNRILQQLYLSVAA